MQTFTQTIMKKLMNPYVMIVISVGMIEVLFSFFYLLGIKIFPQLLQTPIIMVPGLVFFFPSLIALLSLEPAQAEALFHGEASFLNLFRLMTFSLLPTGVFWSLLVSGIVYIVQRRKRTNTVD